MARSLALSAGLMAIALTASAAPPPAPADQIEAQVFEAANGLRAENGLPVLEPNATLAAEARDFAEYLARTGQFSHTADGRNPGDRARAAGYDYCELAENIAYEEDDSGFGPERLTHLFMNGWENSPGHRRNLLSSDVTQTGVGVARAQGRGSVQKHLAVQVFGRPASTRYDFEIENRSVLEIAFQFDGVVRQVPPHATLTEATCSSGQIVFQHIGRRPSSYAVEAGARYVLSDAPGGVRVEMIRGHAAGGRPEWD
jgi:uncharacterized protein YkwD